MHRKDDIRSNSDRKKVSKFLNRNIFAFAFFLVLSFFFWYLNGLSKDIEAEIKYPVVFKNFPKEKVSATVLPEKLSIVLAGPGYSILKQKLGGTKIPLEIDFSKSAIKTSRTGKSQKYFIASSGLIKNFNSQLKSDCKIILLKPDTIFITLN